MIGDDVLQLNIYTAMTITPEMTRVFEPIREDMKRFSCGELRDGPYLTFEFTLGVFQEYCTIEHFQAVQFSFAYTTPDYLYSLIARPGFDFSLMREEDRDCPYMKPTEKIAYNEKTFGHSVIPCKQDTSLFLGVSHWYVPNTMGHCSQPYPYIWTAVFYGIKRIGIMPIN